MPSNGRRFTLRSLAFPCSGAGKLPTRHSTSEHFFLFPTYRVWMGLVILGLTSAPLWAVQADSERTILAVEFTGLARTEETFVKDLARVHSGDRFDPAALDAAVTRLLRTGRFVSARYRTAEADGGVRITFELQERLTITGVRFVGNANLSDRRLRTKIQVKIGQPVDLFAAREGRASILSLYREEGYANVSVTLDEERLARTGEVVYTIDEGGRVRIREILFEGNHSFSDRVLRRKIKTKTAFFFIRSGALDQDRVAEDVSSLQNDYRDRGFLDARVGFRQERKPDGKGLRLVFTIKEGTRYRIEAIEFEGQTVFSVEELLGFLGSRAGEVVHRPQVDADVREIRRRYGEIGYIYATVRAIRVFSQTPGLVRITFKISAGDRFRVGRVVVRGNARTKDKVVRRALNLYPPDDLFNLTEVKKAERQLLDTKIFSSARVFPVGHAPDVRDVVMDVKEVDRLGDFLFGAGVTSNSGLIGSIVLNLQNFDILDPPRSWSEFFKFQSFTGAGQHMRVELQPGSQLSRFRIDFTEPYLLDKPLRLDVSGYLFQRGRDGFDETRTGISTSIGKKFERGRFRGWSGEAALRLENIDVSDVDLFSSSEIRDDEGSQFLNSIKGTMVRDRTDSRFVPSTGDRLRISYEQFGLLGDHAFGKIVTRYTRYKTLRIDVLDRKSIWRVSASAGAILGDAPVFERFFAGGTGSIRGFQFRGVGSRDGIDDNNVGGDALLLLGSQYSFPIFGRNVRGHVFLDTGTAGSGYRASIGAGVRFTINLLGRPLPLELNLAAPFASESGDDEQVFSFVIGRLF